MPIDQAVIDYRVLERFGDAENQRLRVLVVAVRRDSVEHLLAATRRAGLEPGARRPVRLRDRQGPLRAERSFERR